MNDIVPITREVADIVAQVVELDASALSLSDSSTLDSLGADSLDKTEIAMMVESRFNIRFPDSHVHAWHTIGDIATEAKQLISAGQVQ